MKKPHPIRQILSWQLPLLALAPLMIAGLLMVVLLAPKIISETDQYHKSLSEVLVTRIKSYLYEPATRLQAISIALPERQRATEILDDHVAASPIFEAIYLASPDGKIVAVGLPAHRQAKRADYLGTELPHRAFFEEATKQRKLIWSDTFLSTISGRTSVALAMPAQKYLLVGEINLHQLTDYLNQLHDQDVRSLIIGRDGHVVAKSDSVGALDGASFQSLPRTASSQDGHSHVKRFRLDGQDMIGSAETLNNPAWKVWVYEPVANAYQNIYEMTTILVSVAVLALLLVIAASLYLARRLARRFEDFVQHAHSIAIASYDTPPVSSNISEVNQFANSLQSMAEAIKDREQQLKTSERKYRELVESSHDLIILLDLNGIILYANPAASRILGISPGTYLNRSGVEFIHPDDREAFKKMLERWRTEKPPSILHENRLISLHGESLHMLWSISTHQVNDNGQIELLAIGRDTTEQKMHTAREQRLINLQRALSETNDAILRLEQEYALFPLVCRIAVEYGGMMLSWVGTFDHTGTKIVPIASYGIESSYLDEIRISISEDAPTGQGPIAIALRKNTHVVVNDYATDEIMKPWKDHAHHYGVRAGAFFPIMRDGRPYAIFVVNSDQSGAFDEEIVQLLKEIAANIGFALDNFDRESARKLAEAGLRASEERFRSIAADAPFPMQIHAEDGEILLINRAWTETTGYTLSDIPTIAEWTKKACGDYANQAITNIRGLFKGSRRVSQEYTLTCKDGSQRICYFTSSPMNNLPDGRRVMISMAVDVTERRLAEKALQLTHFSVNQASDPLFWATQDGHIHFVNDAACKALGYTEKELLALSLIDLNSIKTFEGWEEKWRELKEKKSTRHETTLRTKTGRLIQVEITSNFVAFEGKEYNCAFVRDITEKKKTEQLVWQQANFDSLTGLPNRSMFLSRLEHEIRKSDRSGLPVALLFLDLDHFKSVNDTLGHNTGDLLLQEAAERLRSCVRETDTVARLGGDEFTIILAELHDTHSIERVARKIQERITEPFYLGDEMVYVSTSIGVTLYPEDATEIEDLLKNADQAMYAAKHEGRKRHHYFTQSMQEAAQARMKLIRDLRVAMDGDQFEVVYQPIIELTTGTIRKAEALIRWRHPTRNLISPTEFIPIAEEIGLIHEIGDWIFWQASDQATAWREQLHPQFQISVNMSPVQFRENEKSRAAWLKYLQSLEIPWLSISVEITEGLLLDANPSIHEQLLAFHDAGMEVAIDDFGIGYSSLSYLKKFDIDYLKIDRSFVGNLEVDSHDMALCEAIIMMAHKLGIKVVAEGVETEKQRSLLAQAGCDFAQGFYFSKPLSAQQFEEDYKNGVFIGGTASATNAQS